jgi:hypothetical protein
VARSGQSEAAQSGLEICEDSQDTLSDILFEPCCTFEIVMIWPPGRKPPFPTRLRSEQIPDGVATNWLWSLFPSRISVNLEDRRRAAWERAQPLFMKAVQS